MSLTEVRYSESRRVQSDWTDARIDLLKEMWEEGKSAKQIAIVLGVTRNAVLGKKDRLKLELRPRGWGAGAPIQHGMRSKFNEPRPARNRRQDGFRRSPIGQPIAPSLPADVDAPSLHACALVDLDDTKCHWPIGDPAQDGFHFCGGTAAHERGPYCAAHYRMAYR